MCIQMQNISEDISLCVAWVKSIRVLSVNARWSLLHDPRASFLLSTQPVDQIHTNAITTLSGEMRFPCTSAHLLDPRLTNCVCIFELLSGEIRCLQY